MLKGEICFVFYVNSVFYGSHEQDIRFQWFTTAHNDSQRFTSPVKENKRYFYLCYVNCCELL